jgi:hypothetical protein
MKEMRGSKSKRNAKAKKLEHRLPFTAHNFGHKRKRRKKHIHWESIRLPSCLTWHPYHPFGQKDKQ